MKVNRIIISALLLAFILISSSHAQQPPAQALKNIMYFDVNGEFVRGNIVWRNGVIEAIGPSVNIPFDAMVTDGGDSLFVYPGFIDGASHLATPEPPRRQERPPRPGEPTYERAGIQPDRSPNQVLNTEDREITTAFNSGITSIGISLRGNMLPGSIDIYNLNGSSISDGLFKTNAGQKFQLVGAQGVYPGTLMAIMARFRQLWFDAQALQEHQKLYSADPTRYTPPGRDLVLESLYPIINGEKRLFVHADVKDDILRVLQLQSELGFKLVLVSGKEAHLVSESLKSRSIPVLASIDIPKKPDWMSKDEKGEVTDELKSFREREKRAWEDARDNIARLLNAGVLVGFATDGMKASEIKSNIDLLLESGLTESDIVSVLSSNTAKILGVDHSMGSLRVGSIASFSLRTGKLSDNDSKIIYMVGTGKKSEIVQQNQSGRSRR